MFPGLQIRIRLISEYQLVIKFISRTALLNNSPFELTAQSILSLAQHNLAHSRVRMTGLTGGGVTSRSDPQSVNSLIELSSAYLFVLVSSVSDRVDYRLSKLWLVQTCFGKTSGKRLVIAFCLNYLLRFRSVISTLSHHRIYFILPRKTTLPIKLFGILLIPSRLPHTIVQSRSLLFRISRKENPGLALSC